MHVIHKTMYFIVLLRKFLSFVVFVSLVSFSWFLVVCDVSPAPAIWQNQQDSCASVCTAYVYHTSLLIPLPVEIAWSVFVHFMHDLDS